jgi:thiosulfate dehydrogenase
MKNLKLLLGMFIFAITFTNCTFDDETTDPSVEAYNIADQANGGIMYDKFWAAESSFDQSDANLATIDDNSNFFRCKQCHGWDGLGNKGAYINRAPKTSRPNVTGFNLYELGQTETAQQIFDDLNKTEGRRNITTDLSTYDPATNYTEGDKMPNLTQVLTEAQMWDLVKFIKEGMFDVTELYDFTTTGTYPTGTWTPSNVGTDGNAANGNAYYTANCVSCHGADGTTIVVEKGTVGNFVRLKGNEAQHKIHYGQLGTGMAYRNITLSEMKDLYKALADETAYPSPL